MNSVILIGRLTRDPELRYIPSTGNALTTFSIAVDRAFTGKDGQKQTDFFNIVVWGKSAEYCANYLAKGRLAAVKGSIQNRTYDTKEGEKGISLRLLPRMFRYWNGATKVRERVIHLLEVLLAIKMTMFLNLRV